MDIQFIGALIGVVSAIIAALVILVAKRLYSAKVGGLEISFERDFKPTANIEKDSRLVEARELLQRQESNAKWNSIATGSLVFGQYVVGGVLATSFVQESLSTKIVGLLGVLVLVSSIVHHFYRPDIQVRGARERVMRLRAIIRHAEDNLFAIKSESKNAPTIQVVRQFVSSGLSEVEQAELRDYTRMNREGDAA